MKRIFHKSPCLISHSTKPKSHRLLDLSGERGLYEIHSHKPEAHWRLCRKAPGPLGTGHDSPLSIIFKKERGFPKHLPPTRWASSWPLSLWTCSCHFPIKCPHSLHLFPLPISQIPNEVPCPNLALPTDPVNPITLYWAFTNLSSSGWVTMLVSMYAHQLWVCVYPPHCHLHIRFLENKALLLIDS